MPLVIAATSPPTVVVVSSDSGWLVSALAIAGVVLSLASLGWQAFTFTRSGSRVRVELKVGAANRGAIVHWTKPGFPPISFLNELSQKGFNSPVLIAFIRNSGRLPVTIQRCSWDGEKLALDQHLSPPGESFPHRLEANDRCIAAIDLRSVVAALDATDEVLGASSRLIRPVVELGSGKIVKGSPLEVPRSA